MGHRKGNGTRKRMSSYLGISKSGGDYMGENELTLKNHTYWKVLQFIDNKRTGHWLNHSKEHCLVGIKGNPKLNANSDCDVIVSEVRETSRKPDEIYGLIERMLPGGRKLELYGRPLNCKKGWCTLGN